MKLWKIDDGALHWVVAKDAEQAFGLYFESLCKTEGGWPKDQLDGETPTISTLDSLEDFTYRPFGDDRKLTAKVGEWLGLFTEPMYLACSEF
jgi:hypothetical protein